MKRLYALVYIFICLFFCSSVYCREPKKAIIIGASSGMGREIARLLSKEGYIVGLAARRLPLLQSLQNELAPRQTYVQELDVTDPQARKTFKNLLARMGNVDLVIISISSYLDNQNAEKTPWQKIESILNVTGKGFISMADVAFKHFKQQKGGHLVGISSTSGLYGCASSPEYSATKAAISTYLQGKRNQMARDGYNITVTDIIPGFVAVEHSPMGQDPAAYWEISTEEAGKTILEGIQQKKDTVYVPKKVCILNLIKLLPKWVYLRYFNWM
jgi:short-subunit dehydrogenase